MTTNNGLPSLMIQFKAAAKAVSARAKRGYVGLILRDTQALGLHVIRDEMSIPQAIGLANKEAVKMALQGSERGRPALVVLAVVEAETTDHEHLLGGLTVLSTHGLDYLAPPPDVTEEEAALMADWVLDQRALYRTVKAVLPHEAANHMGVVNFATDGIVVGKVTYTAAAYCGRIAGILAGIPSDSSATYTPLPEVTAIPDSTPAEQEAAIRAGKLILLHDGQKAKVARAVNSLTDIPPEGQEDWSKIKIVEGMDLVTYFARVTIEDAWLGVYANSYDNKMLLVVALQDFLCQLEDDLVLQDGSSFADLDVPEQARYLRSLGIDTSKMTEQEIREADTGSYVFLQAGGRFLDAMEDFRLVFQNV